MELWRLAIVGRGESTVSTLPLASFLPLPLRVLLNWRDIVLWLVNGGGYPLSWLKLWL